MSKISVFKFHTGNKDKALIEKTVEEYIQTNSLVYNAEENMYTTMKPSKKSDAKNAALSAGATLLTGKNTVYYTMGRGLSYDFVNEQLILKACVINWKMNNAKQSIHSAATNSQAGTMFYRDLKEGLFKRLEAEGVTLERKETEKIDDGSGKAFAIRLLLILGGVIAFILLLQLLM